MPVIGYFEDGGFPAGNGWDELPFPGFNDDHALEVSSHSMLWIAHIVWASQ